MRGRRIEISAAGFDQNLEGIGSDPFGGAASLGLPIPATLPLNPARRFLFLLAQFQVGAGQRGRLVGLRQFVKIGVLVSNGAAENPCQYPLEMEVTSPTWRFTDGNISWHLTRMDPVKFDTNNPSNSEGLQFLDSTTPALLYENPMPDYRGPNGDRPYGTAVVPDLSTFYDLRFPHRGSADQYLDYEFQGPCRIAFWASVRQTDPNTRCRLILPAAVNTLMVPPEDGFVVNFPNAVYTRVGGSIIVESENLFELPRDLTEPRAAIDACGSLDPRTRR